MNPLLETFLKKYEESLNRDDILKRRLKPVTTFSGGPTPYPGPGPYPPPNLAMDPTGWSKAKGYNVTRLVGRDVVELEVPERFVFTVRINDDRSFRVESRKAVNPCLRVSMPLDVFKDMALGKERVVYALADKRNNVEYDSSIGLSDWITVFGIIGKIQELAESDPEVWDLLERL
ncbi:MAG: hypothetical protein QXT53_05685 [Ignisphaera sp.]